MVDDSDDLDNLATVRFFIGELHEWLKRRHPTAPKVTVHQLIILYYVMRGNQDKQIARKLYLASHTIQNILWKLYRRIGAVDRTAAAIWLYFVLQGFFSEQEQEQQQEVAA